MEQTQIKYIDQEIEAFIRHHSRPKGKVTDKNIRFTQDRVDTALISFGFNTDDWLTCEEIAVKKGHQRQAVDQLMRRWYFDKLAGECLPVAKRADAILHSRPFWTDAELCAAWIENGVLRGPAVVPAVLDYLESQGVGRGYAVLFPDFEEATRLLRKKDEYRHCPLLIVRQDLTADGLAGFEAAKDIQSGNGLVRFGEVVQLAGIRNPELLEFALRQNDAVWCGEGDDFWLMFKDRKNTFVCCAERTFAAVEACKVSDLVAVLDHWSRRRGIKNDRPPSDIIAEWVRTSGYFDVAGDTVRFMGDTAPLTAVQQTIGYILEGEAAMPAKLVTSELEARGFTRITAFKAVYHSPIAYLDKKAGRTTYTCTLLSDRPGAVRTGIRYVAAANGNLPTLQIQAKSREQSADREIRIRARLGRLARTDANVEVRRRTEQSMLRRYHLRGVEEADCAICNRLFHKDSLVAAHKKKRFLCTEEERRDPDIAFLVCKFGCDELYEKGNIRIRKGIVVVGEPAKGQTERARVSELVGNRVAARWTARPDYFGDVDEMLLEEAA